jgi:SAM-dependent methyltransferase
MSLEPNRKLTDAGNPAKPSGDAGEEMLIYMNEEHTDLTEWALSLLSYNDISSILDVGCGGGATLRMLASLAPDAALTGVDYSDVSVRLTEKTNADLIKSGRLSVINASVAALPFASDIFDRVITVESFYFWPDPAKSLAEVRRVIAPGGCLMLVSEIYERPDLTPHCRENIDRYAMNVPGID